MAEVTSLDFSGKEQLYFQLYDILFQDIVNGVYNLGDLIPSESELMSLYGVSRATARRAMEMLSNNGLIRKKRGYGSEVIANRPNTSPSLVTSYIKKNIGDKAAAQKKLVAKGVVPAGEDVAAKLRIAAADEVFCLRRVRVSGERPFYCEAVYLAADFVPDAMDHDFSRESLRAYEVNELHVVWKRATQEISACLADTEIASILHVNEGDPLFFIERVSYDAQNVPREYVQSYYRADSYHLELELEM